jgi:threonine/homoserine/homoserine lactone efflux protein
MKWVGGAYLVWLGGTGLALAPIGIDVGEKIDERPAGRCSAGCAVGADESDKPSVLRGVFAAVHRSGRSLLVQFAIMASTFAVIEILTELFIATMAIGSARGYGASAAFQPGVRRHLRGDRRRVAAARLTRFGRSRSVSPPLGNS